MRLRTKIALFLLVGLADLWIGAWVWIEVIPPWTSDHAWWLGPLVVTFWIVVAGVLIAAIAPVIEHDS